MWWPCGRLGNQRVNSARPRKTMTGIYLSIRQAYSGGAFLRRPQSAGPCCQGINCPQIGKIMSKTFDVSLPRNHRPLFPRTCIVCGCSSPKRRVKVSTADSWSSFLKRQSGTSKQRHHQFTANAPACGFCAWRFRFIEWGGIAIAALICGVAFFYFGDMLQ